MNVGASVLAAAGGGGGGEALTFTRLDAAEAPFFSPTPEAGVNYNLFDVFEVDRTGRVYVGAASGLARRWFPDGALAIQNDTEEGDVATRIGIAANGAADWVPSGVFDAVNDAAGYDDNDTSITVDSGAAFHPGDLVRPDGSGEVMLVTGTSTTVITVERGFGGTTAEALTNNQQLDVLAFDGEITATDNWKLALIGKLSEIDMDMARDAIAYVSTDTSDPATNSEACARVDVERVTTPIVYLRDMTPTADSPKFFSSTSPLDGGAYLKVDSANGNMQPANITPAAANPSWITAAKWWVVYKIRPSATGNSALASVSLLDSSGQLALRVNNVAEAGFSDTALFMDLANGTGDATTILKRLAHGLALTLSVYFDGTNLRFKINADDEQVAVFAGTLDPVGTGAPQLFISSSGSIVDFQVFKAGKIDPDGAAAHWAKMVAAHDVLVARGAA